MQRTITLRDLAKALNLTPATVSRALNDSYQISAETKARVRALAEEWNYRPNRMASGLRSSRTMMVGVLVPDIAYNFNSSAIAGIEEVLVAKGYRVIICQTKEKLARETDNLKDLASIRVDGLIASLSAESATADHFHRILPAGTPLVFMDRVPAGPEYSKVMIDNVRSAYLAVMHLIRTGRKTIVWMAGPEGLPISEIRYRGYCQAHHEAGLAVDPSIKVHGPFDSETGYRAMVQLLRQRPDIDAIFTINDRVAVEALAAVRDSGKRVPEDISVMGFNNETFAPLLYPSLTTVFQPACEMGKTAAELLLKRMQGRAPGKPEEYIFETEIIERKSTRL
jgi:DNA-binding LacI/PurR family transcriptional regulator